MALTRLALFQVSIAFGTVAALTRERALLIPVRGGGAVGVGFFAVAELVYPALLKSS